MRLSYILNSIHIILIIKYVFSIGIIFSKYTFVIMITFQKVVIVVIHIPVLISFNLFLPFLSAVRCKIC